MSFKPGSLKQVSMPVSDVDRAVAFYVGVLGLPLLLRPHAHMAFVDLGGVSLFLEQSGKAEDIANCSVLYLGCTDVAADTASLAARGVTIDSPPHRIAQLPAYDLWMSFFRDPDGHLLALHMEAPKGWSPPT